ncbi:DUF2252 family protein [Paenibacillus oryzisoli]|uniref:DUF2252 family protein n=1 Tax=Paenibacillus oryzisoli TaxID=1850517 RepID=UPI003D27819C
MQIKLKRLIVKALIAALVLPTAYLPGTATEAEAAEANHVVISEVFSGGGHNEDSPYKNDFIELYNPTGTVQSLDTWSVQFIKAENASDDSSLTVFDSVYRAKVSLTGSIQPHGYYLIKLGGGPTTSGYTTGSGKEIDNPDAEDTSLNMNKDGGIVALLNSSDDFNFDATTGGHVVDFMAYGGTSGKSKPFLAKGTAAGKPSAQKSIIRKAANPSDGSAISGLSGSGVFAGNGYDSGNNATDFEVATDKSQVNPQDSSSSLRPMAYATVTDGSVAMGSLKGVNASNDAFQLTAAYGTPKVSLVQGTDYTIDGLPAGLVVTATAAGSSITFTISGQASASVTEDQTLSVILLPSAFQSGIYTASSAITGITLAKFEGVTRVTGTVTDGTVSMESATAISSADDTFTVTLGNGLVKNGTLSASDFTVTPADLNGLSLTAAGDGNKTVSFRVSGTASTPIVNDLSLAIVLKKEAVTAEADEDSNVITGFTIKRPTAPLLNDAARKTSIVDTLKQANSFHSDLYDKNYKYSEMKAKAFKFFRGNSPVFYKDLGTAVLPIPEAWKAWNHVNTWIEGDAHTRNIGFYDHNDGQPYFDINDPDESYVAPFYFDLIRFIASIYITKDDVKDTKNASLADTRQAAKDFLDQYKAALESVNGNDDEHTAKMDERFLVAKGFSYSDYMLKTFYGSAPVGSAGSGLLDGITNAAHLNGYTQVVGDNRQFVKIANATDSTSANEKLLAVSTEEENELRAGWAGYVAQTRQAASDKNAYFTMKDMSRVIEKGLGSIGVRRYFILVEGPTDSQDDDIILDVKQQKAPALTLNTFLPIAYSAPNGDAARTKTAYDALSVVEDAYVGPLTGTAGRTFMIREVSAYDRDYDDKKFGSFGDFKDFLKASAMAYAYGHARADRNLGYSFEEGALAAMNADWTTIRDTMVNLGEDYAKQVQADYSQFAAVADADLIDISELKGLAVSAGSLSPAFSSKQLSYAVNVANSVYTASVSASSIDPAATISINGSNPAAGKATAQIALQEGSNGIAIVVKAEDQSTKTYNVTIYRDSGSSGGSGGPVSTPSTPTSTVTEGNNQVITTTEVKSTLDSSGKATATVTSGQVMEALTKLSAVPGSDKATVLEIKTTVDAAAKQAVVSVPAEAWAKISESGADALTLSAGLGQISLDKQALKAVQSSSTSGAVDVSIRKTDAAAVTENWTPEGKQALASAIGNRPVFDLTITAGGTKVSSFNGGSVQVTIPYQPAANEDANAIVAYYVAGELVKVTNSLYDAASGSLIFNVSHFSQYAVGYARVDFRDTAGSFAKDYITYLSARNIINGTAEGQFTPYAPITRADFTLMLARMAGAQLDGAKASSFRDVAADSYYAQSVQWAAEKGITSGVSADEFAPAANITREQMVTMLVRYAALVKLSLPQAEPAASFADSAEIPAFAAQAAKTMQQAGIISGKSGGRFAPKDLASREEAAKILGMLMQLSAR